MNITMTPKKEGGQPEQVTKLAIGKPGGIDADTDKYDTDASVFCRACDKNLDMTNPQVASLVDSILLSNSAFNQTGVEEWELELKECNCVKNLDQSEAKVVTSMEDAKCNDCDLRTNLWMNMHDGHLGCGRKYFDGSGANNHAVDHGK